MSVNAEIALTFPPGMRNWNTGVSRRDIEVLYLQALQSRLRHDTWQEYFFKVFDLLVNKQSLLLWSEETWLVLSFSDKCSSPA